MKLKPEIKNNHLEIVSMRIAVNNIEGVKNFIQNYPDVIKYVHTQQKYTLLSTAIHHQRKELVDLLITLGSDISPDIISKALRDEIFSRGEEKNEKANYIKHQVLKTASLKNLELTLNLLHKDIQTMKKEYDDLIPLIQMNVEEVQIKIEKMKLEKTVKEIPPSSKINFKI
jgi:hypothetical protein